MSTQAEIDVEEQEMRQKEILRGIRTEARRIEAGKKAQKKRDELFAEGRDAKVPQAKMAEAAGVKVHAVKFALQVFDGKI
jgi:hypothetical protein